MSASARRNICSGEQPSPDNRTGASTSLSASISAGADSTLTSAKRRNTSLAGDDDADIPDEPLELLWLAEMDAIQVEEDPTWLLKAARLDRTEPYEYGWPMSKKETLIVQILRRGAHRWRFAPNLVIEIDNVVMKA